MIFQNLIMKLKKLLLLPLISLLLLPGCQKQETPAVKENGLFTITAELPDASEVTKTSLRTSDFKVLWSTGDKISVNGVLSNAVVSGDNGKPVVDFTFDSTPSSPYNTLYPGTTSTSKVVFPTTQAYVADSFDSAAAPSYGVAVVDGNTANVSLRPLGALIRFAINGSATISKIVLNARGGESITGNFTVNFSTGALTPSGNNGTSLTYNIEGGKTLSGTDTHFYLSVPARNFTQGFEALVYEKDTEKYACYKFFGSGKTLNKGALVQLESKTYAAGRVEELVQINDFTAESAGDPETRAEFTVATYNLFSNEENTRTGRLALANCGAKLGDCVKATGADIIGFNEIDETFATSSTQSIQKLAEAQGLTGYTWKITNPNKVTHEWLSYDKEYTYANGFAYNGTVLQLVDFGYYWYNKNGGYTGTASTAYGSHLSKFRTIVWAKFKHIASNKTFNVIFTHMPIKTDDNSDDSGLAEGVAHNYAATAINAFMQAKDSTGPWLLVGDLNAFGTNSKKTDPNNAGYTTLKTKWTDAYEDMLSDGTLSEFYQNYPGTQSGSAPTYYYDVLTFTKNHSERRIDHIMYRGGFKAEDYKTIRLTYDYDDEPSCPSDHLPVVVKVSLGE